MKRAFLSLIVVILLAATVWFLASYFYSQETGLSGSSTNEITKDEAANVLRNLPLSFQKNEGQVDEQVDFLVKNGSTTIFFTPEEVVYSIIHKNRDDEKLSAKERSNQLRDRLEDEEETNTVQVIRQEFVSANSDVEIEGFEQAEGKVNYFIGNDPDKWVKNAPTFERIVYQNLYDGVDLHYSGKTSQLKYEYHVEPRVDYNQIKVRVSGIEEMSINPNGDLVLVSKPGNIGLKAPEVFQFIDGKRIDIDSAYVLYSSDEYGFSVGGYNPEYELIIDPYLVYST